MLGRTDSFFKHGANRRAEPPPAVRHVIYVPRDTDATYCRPHEIKRLLTEQANNVEADDIIDLGGPRHVSRRTRARTTTAPAPRQTRAHAAAAPASCQRRARAATTTQYPGRQAKSRPRRTRRPSCRASMAASPAPPASPEDRSEAHDPPSAPSELLAEFLSAIMQRQYAEALHYCRLILQYEPRNATARGFYPLLQHKLRPHRSGGEQTSSSEEGEAERSAARAELMEQDDDSGSVSSQSSLELDSEGSRRSDSDSAPPSAASDTNGNLPPDPGDLENDNAAPDTAAPALAAHHLKVDKDESSTTLRRLRAQFACSIK